MNKQRWCCYFLILVMVFSIFSSVFVQYPNIRADSDPNINTSTPTVVDTDINSSITYWSHATRLPSHTQTFYAMGRFWCIYRSRDHVMSYKTSSDNTTWSGELDIFDFGSTSPSAFFDCHVNETKIHIVGCNSSLATDYVKYRRGNLNSNGTITWDAPEQNALDSNLYWSDPSITVDNNGYAYVAATRWGGNDSILVRKNANNDGTWSTDWSYWIDKYDYNFGQLLTLSGSNHVYILYYSTYNDNRTAYPIHGRLWNGTGWSAEETINTTLNLSTQYWTKLTSVAVNDDIHIVYSENVSNNITYANRIGGTWGNFTNLYSNANNATGVISYAKNTGDLFVLWQNYPSWNGTYYIRYDNGTTTWNTTPILIVNETVVGYTQQSILTCSHESWNNTISCMYLIGQSSPATLKHFYFNFTQSAPSGDTMNVTTNATTGVGQQNATLHGFLENDSGETCRVGFQWGETTGYGHTDFDLSFTSGWNPPPYDYFQFPKDIWLYNSSVGSNTTCENFLQQGGVYDTVDWILRDNSTPGAMVSWNIDREINELSHMDNSTDHPEFSYTFHSTGADTLSFTYDNLTATTGDEFGHEIGINGGLHLYGLTPGTTYHYRAFATNSTTTIYGSDMTFTTATNWSISLNCFNASDGSPITDWDVFVTNQDGSETYVTLSNNNPHVINISNGTCPVGTNIAFIFSKQNYTNRTYYMDITSTGNHSLDAYLDFYNDSNLYLLNVIDAVDQVVPDAKMEIKKYINETVGYQNITILYTDANGQCDVWLTPGSLHKAIITKEGYQDEIADYIPSDTIRTHTFRMEFTEPTEPTTYIFWDVISFNAVSYSNGSIRVTYIDSSSLTTNTQFYMYSNYNTTNTLVDTKTRTGENSITYWVTGLNLSRLHYVNLYFNHTYNFSGTQPIKILIFPINGTTNRTQLSFEAALTAVLGQNDLGWGNCIAFIVAIVLLCSFSPFQVGIGIISAGTGLVAVQTMFVFSNIYIIVIIPIVIFVGIFYILATREPGEHL